MLHSPISSLPILVADDDTIRWNYPLSIEPSMEPTVLRPVVPSPTERREVAHSGSLFDVLVGFIAKELDDRPVYVEFSGGCDSSVIIAAAQAACRAANHDDPIPLTYRYPLQPETDESDYQDAVLTHLGLGVGHRISITSEFDLLGPVAQRCMERHGLAWPAAGMVRTGVWEQLEPGTLLSGEGGDDALGPRRIAGLARAMRELKRRRPRAVAGNLVRTIGPRGQRMRRFDFKAGEWLSAAEGKRFVALAAADPVGEPLSNGEFATWFTNRPAVRLANHQLIAMAASANQRFVAPFMDPAFVCAVDDLSPRWQLLDRRAVLRMHFADHLPKQLIDRTDKRFMSGVFFNEHAREFARHWDGRIFVSGIDSEALRSHWTTAERDAVSALSFMLLQAAWMAAR